LCRGGDVESFVVFAGNDILIPFENEELTLNTDDLKRRLSSVMKMIFSCFVLALAFIFLPSCQKQKVDPNGIDLKKVDVQYSGWEGIDMDGKFSVEISEDDVALPRYPYYGKIPETAILYSKNTSKSIFSGLKETDVVFTFLKMKGREDMIQENILPDEEYHVTNLLIKPGRSGNSNADYDIIQLYFTVSKDSFSSKVALDIRKYIDYGVYDEDPDFKGKDQAFFKNYLKDVFKVKHIVLKGVTMEQLEANQYTDYNSIIKAFNIPD